MLSMFPSPPEVTEVSYFIEVKIEDQEGNMFPSPLEETGGSYQLSGENDNPRNLLFPPPSEVNGGFLHERIAKDRRS